MEKGYTGKPCHGCGASYKREKGQLCDTCQKLLNQAKEINKKFFTGEDLVPVTYSGRSYGNGGYSFNSLLIGRGNSPDKIASIMLELANLLSAHDPKRQAKTKDGFSNSPLKDELLGKMDRCNFQTYRLMEKGVAEMIRGLDSLIREYGKDCFNAGKSNGQNLLVQLHSGHMGINDFNKELDKIKE